MKSKVSILLLSYNQKEFIKDSIESSLNQSYKNLEIVISDNGSTDGTDEIIKSYQDHPQVKLLLNNSNEFIGLGEVTKDRQLKAKRLINIV